ncbi:hypothetical protein JXM67_12235 [candidate division WOR-3 bacterium]|nr:hypothetical protein [candidate division WOR-3 bacterium]
MKHKVYYDEDIDAAVLELEGEYTSDEAHETFDELAEIFAGKDHFRLIIDLTGTNVVPGRQARKVLEERGKAEQQNFLMAFVVTNPMARMTAKFIASVMGKREVTGFFKTRAQAAIWLKESK